MMQGNPSFVQSEQTQKLVQALRGVNREITYDSLSLLVGFPVLNSRAALGSARRILKANEQIIFDVVRGKGLVRLNGPEKVGLLVKNRRGIHNAAKRGLKNVKAITDEEYVNLTAPEQLREQLISTTLTVIADSTSARKLPKLEKPKVDNVVLSESLASARALALTDVPAARKPKPKSSANNDLSQTLASFRR